MFSFFNSHGKRWKVNYGGISQWEDIRKMEISPNLLHVGDFDGDGQADVAIIQQGKVKFSAHGTADFVIVKGETYKEFGFLFADFNGDGKTDIFNGNGEEWRVLFGGGTEWTLLRNHTTPTNQLAVGYFNEPTLDGTPDKIADIFKQKGTEWRVWYGGKKTKQVLKTTSSEEDLLFGDFNTDGITDVLRIKTQGN